MGRLEGKVAIITGGGTGIGRAVAERFVAEGAKVAITGRTESKLNAVAENSGGAILPIVMDVSKPEDCERAVKAATEAFGSPTVLVNNAGLFDAPGPVHEITAEAWDEMMAVNLRGPFLMTKAVVPGMIEAGVGAIVNIGSILAECAVPGVAHYSASKAGLVMLTRSTAIDLGPKGIRCNAVCPGMVKTELTEALWTNEEISKQILADYPLGRFAEPEDLAGAVLHLASDESAWTTGSVLMVDGGFSAR